MGKILMLIFIFGILFSVLLSASFVFSVLRKKASMEEPALGEAGTAVMAALAAYIPVFFVLTILASPVPQGIYQTTALCKYPRSDMAPFALNAEICVWAEKDTSYGAREETVYIDGVQLVGLYNKDGKKIFDGSQEITPNQFHLVCVSGKRGDYDLMVNIGQVSRETLGISNQDIWDRIGMTDKLLVLAATLGSAFLAIQSIKTRK